MIGLRERRASVGMSQEALADASGVGIRTIRRIESDRTYAPSVVNAARIAQALGTTIDALIHEGDSATHPSGRVEIGGGPTPIKKRAASTTQGA